MQELANTEHYTLAVDARKNRIYVVIRGFWQEQPDFPEYQQLWNQLLSMVRPGFTVLADMSELKVRTQEWVQRHELIQQQIHAAGIVKAAEIIPEDVIVKMQFDHIGKQAGIPRRVFSDRTEAETWLDSETE